MPHGTSPWANGPQDSGAARFFDFHLGRHAFTQFHLIAARIAALGDWRGAMLGPLRRLIKKADPDIAEGWNWRGVPVRALAGIICTGDTHKNLVKITFAKGAALPDPQHLFNASLDGNTRRAIDFREGDKIDDKALKALIRAAVTLNQSKPGR